MTVQPSQHELMVVVSTGIALLLLVVYLVFQANENRQLNRRRMLQVFGFLVLLLLLVLGLFWTLI